MCTRACHARGQWWSTGYSYNNPQGYQTTNGKKYLAGDYNWNIKNELQQGGLVEIYLIK